MGAREGQKPLNLFSGFQAVPRKSATQETSAQYQQRLNNALTEASSARNRLIAKQKELKQVIPSQKKYLQNSDAKDAVDQLNKVQELLKLVIKVLTDPSNATKEDRNTANCITMSVGFIQKNIYSSATSRQLTNLPVDKLQAYVDSRDETIKKTKAFKQLDEHKTALKENQDNLGKVNTLISRLERRIELIQGRLDAELSTSSSNAPSQSQDGTGSWMRCMNPFG